ncbi:MAG: phosphate ABC transporter permease PstA [Actinobacteria bacterium]|nr:phosphate ABC transporter permease PstA [Actinomycetota bacterium]
MATVDVAVPRNISIDRSLRGKRSDIPGLAFQLAMLACLLVCLAFIVVLLVTVFDDGIGVFQERGFVLSAFPTELERAIDETWTFLTNPQGVEGWLLCPLVLVGVPIGLGLAARARRWRLVLGVVLGISVIYVAAAFIGTSSFLSANVSSLSSRAGVAQGIFGTVVLAVMTAVVAFPLGVATAVFLEEYAPDNRFTRFVQLNIRNLAGVPSVVYGLLGLAVFVKLASSVTGGRTLIAGGLTLAILVLPIVIITASEAIRAVPQSLREGGYGVGATQWDVTKTLVLPNAFAGILTGTILSLSRAIGETAPLLLVGAVQGFFTTGDANVLQRFSGRYTALPQIVFNWRGEANTDFAISLTAAAIIVLLVITLLANLMAVLLRNRFEKRW